MHFTSYLPLGLLVLIPGIILLYILKQKSEDKDISSLSLWRETYKNIEVSKPWEKLKNHLLMYLQIAVVLGLILGLAGPYIMGKGEVWDSVVLVFDSSGSMNAMYNKETSRFEYAKKQALQYVEQLQGNTEITLITCDQTAKVLLSGAKDKRNVKETISNLECSDVAGNMDSAVSMAESITGETKSYQALIFTDGSVDMGKLQGEVVDLSSQGKNGAVDYVNGDYATKSKLSAVAKVTNYGTETLSSDVNLYLGDKMVAVEPVEDLEPGKDTVVYFSDISVENEKDKELVLKAELNENDMLLQDNVSYDILRKKEEQSILLVTKQNVFLEKAILAMDTAKLYKATSYENAKDSRQYDLYIFDGIKPKEMPEGNMIFINPVKGTYGEWFQVDGKKSTGSLVTAKKHTFTSLLGEKFSFGVNQYEKITPTGKADVFLQCGKDPVGFVENGKKSKVAVLAFDLHKSDFALQTEFPILMSQMFQHMLQGYLLSEPVVVAGESYEVNQVSYRKDQVGLYREKGEVASEQKEESLAVNFPTTTESELFTEVSVKKETKEQKVTKGSIRKQSRNIKTIVIWLVFGLLFLEWIAYLRRR